MIQKPISVNTSRRYMFSKLASYYSQNNIPIHFHKDELPKANKGIIDRIWRNGDNSTIGKEVKKEYLKKIRDTFNLIRDKAILLCKLSSGLDDCDLFNLTIEKYKKGLYSDYGVCYLQENREKSDIEYQMCLSSEACEMINLYLEERKRKGDLLNEKSWLFVSDANFKRKIKDSAFSESLMKVCKKLDIKNVTPKSLRRWFNSTLKNAKIDNEVVEKMLGHIIGVSERYKDIFEDSEEFIAFYCENIENHLSLGNGGKKLNKIDERVIKIEEQNKKKT